MTTDVVDLGAHRLRVAVRTGDPRRTPLLLVNGIGAALEAFEPLVDALDPAIPLIRFDPPGIGGSPLPAGPYRLARLARTVLGLLDRLGHDQVDVLGISWGGCLAQQLARTGGGRCRRLVLVATGIGVGMVPAAPHVLARLATPGRHRDRDHLRRVAPTLYGGAARTDPDLAARVLQAHTRIGSRGHLYQLLALAGWTSAPFLPTLRQPTLVLTGDDDPVVPPLNGRLLSTLIPKARLHVYRGGHLDLVATPERLVPVIEDFLHGDHPTTHHLDQKESTT